MVVAERPFEIVAECVMSGLPDSADIARFGARLEQLHRQEPAVVRATIHPPARFRDRGYVLEARFLVWGEDGDAATGTIERLLQQAEIPCRGVHLSGRAITEADVPPPGGRPAASARSAPAAEPRQPRQARGAKPRQPRQAPTPKTREPRPAQPPTKRGRAATGKGRTRGKGRTSRSGGAARRG